MGCATSKHDNSPAMALCRERWSFLDEAVRLRFAFAEAHIAYLHSLSRPLLHSGKGDSSSPSEKIHHHLHSHFDDDTDSLHHHDVSSPPHHQQKLNFNIPNETGGFMNVNYMKNHTQRPIIPETIYMAQSSSFYPNPNYSNYGGGGGYFGGSSELVCLGFL